VTTDRRPPETGEVAHDPAMHDDGVGRSSAEVTMSDPAHPTWEHTSETRAMPALPPAVTVLADHWGAVLASGLLALGLGLTLALWPGETLVVVTVILAIQLLVSGVLRVVSAVGASGMDTGVRALVGLWGALAIVVGLVVLRDPVRTLTAIALVLGVWWVVSGLIDVIGALVSPRTGRRGLEVASGLVSAVTGAFVLVAPDLSLGVLVLVVCIWLFAIGIIAVLAALRLRSARSG
jgi:uncharacterized membrane protein HdeD (DUF308 family)